MNDEFERAQKKAAKRGGQKAKLASQAESIEKAPK